METRAHYILVGLFTLATGFAALAYVLWVTEIGEEREVHYYEVLFREPVSGLTVGSPVQYSGIRVGEVEELFLDPLDPRIVRARIEVSTDAPVKVDTVARRILLNVTGASAIELSEGLPESPRLTATEGIPTIEAASSSLAQLRLTSEELLVSASNLLERANRMLSDENAERVSRVLDNVDVIAAALAEQQEVLRQGLEGLAENSRSLNELLVNANDILVRNEEPLVTGVTSALADLQQISEQMNTMLVENSPALAAGMQGFAELAPAMRDLRAILNDINAITQQISDDPARFVLGSDNIREYRP